MTDQNRKTLRSFYCRDYLWELFEQMTQELGCSMDYLINESMRLYARSRDYAPGEGGPQQSQPQSQPQRNPSYSGQQQQQQQQPANRGGYQQRSNSQNGGGSGMDHRTFQRVPAVRGNQQQQQQQGFQQQQQPQPQQQQQRGPGGPPPPPPRPGQQNFQQPQQQQQQQRHQQSPRGGGFGGPQQQQRQPLYMVFNNNRYVIDNDKFVIGRGSQQTDLTIRDGNISRKHCAVIHRNGNFYIKDLDSTNGIEYNGNRIESKRIEEGDVFYLCDYALQFTYSP